jgi:maltodextrin utilization protein YvdJ
MSDEAFAKEAQSLVALAFGIVIVIAVSMAVLLGAYFVTGNTLFLWLNLLVALFAIASFAYLVYRRNRLTLGY